MLPVPQVLIVPQASAEVPAYLAPTAALVVAAAAIGYLSVRAGVVPIVGFLLAGVLIGPSQLGLVASTEAVDAAAEVGVILLLFTIGIEFSLERLARVWRWIVGSGGAQVVVTSLLTAALVVAFGEGWGVGLFTGFLVALSSTAIVLTVLSDKNATNTPRGQLSLAVLVFQDLAVVAMVVVVPLLGADAEGGAGSLGRALGTAALVIGLVLVVARRVMPPLLGRVAALCSPEVFLLAIVAICLGTAYVTALAGVSVSLGAFLAGLVVSESRQSTQALSEILPLQIIFSAVFFVSVGMLLDVGALLENLPLVLAAALGVLVLKTVVTFAAVLPTGQGWRTALATSLLLAQVGEFSFVLLTVGRDAGLSPAGLGEQGFQLVVATTVLLMMATPGLAYAGDRLLAAAPRRVDDRAPTRPTGEADLTDHVVLLGWGEDSVDLARILRDRDVPVVMTTLNPAGAEEAAELGIHVVTGDSSRGAVLDLAAVGAARLVVIAEDRPEQAEAIATVVRTQTDAPVMVRSRGAADVASFAQAGVDHVVDPLATSRRGLFVAALDLLELPRDLGPDEDRRFRVDTSRVFHRPVPADAGCVHGESSRPVLPSAGGCLQCLREGLDWVHLRVCLACGHVGCCDSSEGRHARGHAELAGHPIAGSAEPGESWAYCFVDRSTFD
ncbi:cation:proton antiporter [Nocardioidaceae bacterium]|nr:cation:proton antiporter [Nocardioidaceae bacterium]